MVTNFESTFTAVVNADDKFMHATKCVVAGWISTFNLDELRDGPVFVYWISWILRPLEQSMI